MPDLPPDEVDYGDDEKVTSSSGCVFCNLKFKPTRCPDGWFHLFDDGRTAPCLITEK